jgi:hypothetical protein
LFVQKGAWFYKFGSKKDIDDEKLLSKFNIYIITRLHKTRDELGGLTDTPGEAYRWI